MLGAGHDMPAHTSSWQVQCWSQTRSPSPPPRCLQDPAPPVRPPRYVQANHLHDEGGRLLPMEWSGGGGLGAGHVCTALCRWAPCAQLSGWLGGRSPGIGVHSSPETHAHLPAVIQYLPNFFYGALLLWFGIEIRCGQCKRHGWLHPSRYLWPDGGCKLPSTAASAGH